MLAARRKGWAPAGGKRLLRYFSVVALLLVGFRFGHAIVDDADRGSEDGGAKPDDMGGRRRDLDLQTVDPPGSSSSRGVVALEGDSSIDTQSDDDDYGNNSQDLSLCLLLIVRDEETSMRINLPLWRDVAHCYVIGVDDRTTDGTVQAIHDALEEDTPRFVFLYTFENFSQARNAVLSETWRNFPQASHIMIADADWRPTLDTIDVSELDFHHRSFHFLIWDHTGHTTRLAGWLLRSDERLRFKYRIHETLDRSIVSTDPGKLLGWQIRVVESGSGWHAAVHGHSRTAERFLFDLSLLAMDYADDPTDLHTLFYSGITTFSYMESLVGKGSHERTAQLDSLIEDGMFYFRQAIDLYGEKQNLEFVWSSIRWLAYSYHYFMGNSREAERWYHECIDYDPSRVDCIAFLSRVHSDSGNLVGAWDQAKIGLLHHSTQYRPVDYFYVYECFVPIQAATVISKRVKADSTGGDSIDALLTLGSNLVGHYRIHCKHGAMVDTPGDIDNLDLWFIEAAQKEGVDVEETKRRTLLLEEVTFLKVLLSKWGTGKKAVEYGKVLTMSSAQNNPDIAEDSLDGAPPADFSDADASSIEEEDASAMAPVLDSTREETVPSLDSPLEANLGGGGRVATNQESAPSPSLLVSGVSCASMVQEAKERLLDPHSRGGGGGRGEAADSRKKANKYGIMAATSIAQITSDAKNVAARASSTGESSTAGSIRALIFGGSASGGRSADGGDREGLDFEELLQVVSLLVQVPSSSRPLEVTYAHPDLPILEAARTVVSSCPKELGISGGALHFVHSTLDDFLDATISQTFDYVDVGGPLSRGGGGGGGGRDGRNNDTEGAKTPVLNAGIPVLNADTLRRLGPKLAPGARVRVWAFAANPSTEAMFRVAARKTTKTTTSFNDGAMTESSRIAEEREKTLALLGEVLRTSFFDSRDERGGGLTRDVELARDVEVTASDTFEIGTSWEGGLVRAGGSRTPERERDATATEEAWARQVLAGGDRLGLPDIDEVLAEGGFELAFVLGNHNVSRPENDGVSGVVAGEQGLSAMDLLQQGMTRWEIADFADSLAATPRLVNQVLAVWRDG